MNDLTEYLPELFERVKKQLEDDKARWGDTWKHRPRQGQEERIKERIDAYFDQWRYGGQPIPWLKIIGLAIIALVREGENDGEMPNRELN